MQLRISPKFKREAKRLRKKYPSLDREVIELGASLLENPFQGIHLGKDCYKIRMAIASKGKGKSGGGRVITCVKIEQDNIYLLTIYDKSEKTDLEANELDEILKAEGLFPAD
jgi:mRNA-degrading endonuclease RelE of RelBE toxin-antitoxin system